MEPKIRIIKSAWSLFAKRGIRSVTMDDISRELGISKKTLYQYFSNKGEIVNGVVSMVIQEEKRLMTEILEKSQDPVEEMLLHLQAMEKLFAEIPQVLIYQIRKYYPEAWDLFEDFKSDCILKNIQDNLTTGVKLGLFRPEMNLEIVAKLRMMEMEMILTMEVDAGSEHEPTQLQMELFRIFLHGVVTMRGKKLIYKYLNQPEDE